MTKRIKKVLTHEELQQEKVIRELDKIEEKLIYCPEPSIKYEIGEEVYIGHLKDCKIESVHHDGKVYVIDYTDFNNNYGNPIEKPNTKMVSIWYEISSRSMEEETKFTKEDDVRINYLQQTITSLFHKVYSFGTNFEPEYQREHVWELEDKVALIDSIFNNVDIGKFSFIHYDDQKWRETNFSYEILDGKQRLTALCEFYEGRFEYKGKTYHQLSTKDKRHFKGFPVSVGEVQNATEEEIIKYFIKLNSHGRIMSKEHLDKVKEMLK